MRDRLSFLIAVVVAAPLVGAGRPLPRRNRGNRIVPHNLLSARRGGIASYKPDWRHD